MEILDLHRLLLVDEHGGNYENVHATVLTLEPPIDGVIGTHSWLAPRDGYKRESVTASVRPTMSEGKVVGWVSVYDTIDIPMITHPPATEGDAPVIVPAPQ